MEPGSALPGRNRNSHPKIHRFKRILYPPLPGEASNLKERSGWRQTSSLPTLPPHMPVYSRYEPLTWKARQSVHLHQRCCHGCDAPRPCPPPQRRWVGVVGDSFLRVQYATRTVLLGKSAASLGPKLSTALGNFPAGFSFRLIHCCSSMWVAMKPQHILQGQSKETSWPGDGW